jgi:hypothetical protein
VRAAGASTNSSGFEVTFSCSQAPTGSASCSFTLGAMHGPDGTRTAPRAPPSTAPIVVPYAPNEAFDGVFNLRILVDTSVIEVYAQHGRAVATQMYMPLSPLDTEVRLLQVLSAGPTGRTLSQTVDASIEVYSMGSAYKAL